MDHSVNTVWNHYKNEQDMRDLVKRIESALGESPWDTVMEHLPRYHQCDEVLLSDIMTRAKDNELDIEDNADDIKTVVDMKVENRMSYEEMDILLIAELYICAMQEKVRKLES